MVFWELERLSEELRGDFEDVVRVDEEGLVTTRQIRAW